MPTNPSIRIKPYTDPSSYRQHIKISESVGDILDLFRKIFPDVKRAYKIGLDRVGLESAMIMKRKYTEFYTTEHLERRYQLGHDLKNFVQDPNAEAMTVVARVDITKLRYDLESVPNPEQIGTILNQEFSKRSQEAVSEADLDGLLTHETEILKKQDEIIKKFAPQIDAARETYVAGLDDYANRLSALNTQYDHLRAEAIDISFDAQEHQRYEELKLQAGEIADDIAKLHDEALRFELKNKPKALHLLQSRQDRELRPLLAQHHDVQREFYARVADEILQASPVSESQATVWADAQEVSPAAERRLKTQGYLIEDVRKDMAEFYRLTGGRLPYVSIVTEGRRRACAWMKNNKVSIDGDFSKVTLFHEMAHLLENDQPIKMLSNQFLANRCAGKSIKPLSKLDPGKRYRKDERAYEDEFFSPYIGKIYPDAITEVMSMGVQMYAKPQSLGRLYKDDPEMFHIINGLLLSPPPIKMLEERVEMGGKHLQRVQRKSDFYDELSKKSGSGKFLEGNEHRVQVIPIAKFGGKRPSHYRVHASVNENPDEMVRLLFGTKSNAYGFAYLWLLDNHTHTKQALYQLMETVLKSIVPNWYKNPENPKSLDHIPELP